MRWKRVAAAAMIAVAIFDFAGAAIAKTIPIPNRFWGDWCEVKGKTFEHVRCGPTKTTPRVEIGAPEGTPQEKYAENATRVVMIAFETGYTPKPKEVVKTAPYPIKEENGTVNNWAAWKVTFKDSAEWVLRIDDDPATTLKIHVLKVGKWF